MTGQTNNGNTPPDTTLPELVAAAVGGSGAAWTALIARFAPLVAAMTHRYHLTPSDADDVAQTVWLRLVEHLKDLREPRALPGWIRTTTRNEALRVLSAGNRVEVVDPQADARLEVDQRRRRCHQPACSPNGGKPSAPASLNSGTRTENCCC